MEFMRSIFPDDLRNLESEHFQQKGFLVLRSIGRFAS